MKRRAAFAAALGLACATAPPRDLPAPPGTWRSRRPHGRSAYGWKEGQTHAFLIDVLADDGATSSLRIHYQDAASNPELGWPPRELLAERRVDLALFFLRDPGRPLRVVPLTDLPDLIDRLRDTLPADRFSVPASGAQVRFRVCEPG